MRGGLDTISIDFETDLYKVSIPGEDIEPDHFLNIFENNDGEAFIARRRPVASTGDVIELLRVSG